MMTEFSTHYERRSDLVFVSRAGYATEIEVKISLADWNNDQKKRDWSNPPRYIKNFYYAIPETLENKIPDWVPDYAGIVVVRDGGIGYDYCDIVRACKPQKAEKIPDEQVETWIKNCYYRYWRQAMTGMAQRFRQENNKRKIENGTS